MPNATAHEPLDFGMLSTDSSVPAPVTYDVDHVQARLEKACPLAVVSPEEKAASKPVSVSYLCGGKGPLPMFVFAIAPTKIIKASTEARREGPGLNRAIEAAMNAHPGCDIVCSPKRSWAVR